MEDVFNYLDFARGNIDELEADIIFKRFYDYELEDELTDWFGDEATVSENRDRTRDSDRFGSTLDDSLYVSVYAGNLTLEVYYVLTNMEQYLITGVVLLD